MFGDDTRERHDPDEAPEGFFAVLKSSLPQDKGNLCRFCDWRRQVIGAWGMLLLRAMAELLKGRMAAAWYSSRVTRISRTRTGPQSERLHEQCPTNP